MDKRQLGIGLIGAGEISHLHARALREIPEARLAGLWNRNAERAEKRAAEEGCRRFAEAEELVNSPDVDALFVLTNLETHLQYAEMAMKAGKPVLVEKPLGATVDEVRRMKELSESTGIFFMPAHNYVYEESMARARAMIAAGDLGKVVSCYAMYNIHHTEERASTLPGVVRQILTHNLYTLIYLVGKPRRVQAMKANRHYEMIDQEDLALVNLELESGALAHISASFAADDLSSSPWTFTAKVIGTAGTTHYTYQDWVETKQGLAHSRTYTAYQGAITNEDRFFVRRCLTGEGELRSTLDDAILAQQTIEAIERSLDEGRTVEIG